VPLRTPLASRISGSGMAEPRWHILRSAIRPSLATRKDQARTSYHVIRESAVVQGPSTRERGGSPRPGFLRRSTDSRRFASPDATNTGDETAPSHRPPRIAAGDGGSPPTTNL